MKTRADDQARTLTKREHMATEILAASISRGQGGLYAFRYNHSTTPEITQQAINYCKISAELADRLIEALNA